MLVGTLQQMQAFLQLSCYVKFVIKVGKKEGCPCEHKMRFYYYVIIKLNNIIIMVEWGIVDKHETTALQDNYTKTITTQYHYHKNKVSQAPPPKQFHHQKPQLKQICHNGQSDVVKLLQTPLVRPQHRHCAMTHSKHL